jgi:Domain of unknown function (DUF4136)
MPYGIRQTGVNGMKALISSCALFALMIAPAAFAQDVRYNFDKGTDFSQLRTYKWVDIKGAQQVNSLTDKEIKSAVDNELAQKGLTKVEDGNADILVGYQAAVDQNKQFTSYNSGWGYGPGWGGGWYGPAGGMTTTTASTIYTGQLVLDMYNPQGHDLIWRGIASKTIDPKAKPEKQEKKS